MTNQEFCYWLQGYFELSRSAVFNKKTAVLAEETLHQINEPLGEFTAWLLRVLQYFRKQEYRQETLTYFTAEIENTLNAIFLHVIDASYTEGPPPERWQRIHDGTADNEK